jgi:hypothetical protein
MQSYILDYNMNNRYWILWLLNHMQPGDAIDLGKFISFITFVVQVDMKSNIMVFPFENVQICFFRSCIYNSRE